MTHFTNHVALVTGGGRGIGRSTALVLAQYGAAVAVLARTPHEVEAVVAEIQQLGGHGFALVADVANYAEVANGVVAVTQHLGPVDIVINNAGTMPLGPVTLSDPMEWMQTMAVNVVGAYNTIRATLPTMLTGGWGRIINVSSVLATAASSTNRSAYVTSKAALDRLTIAVAAEVAGSGVTVNGMYPGMTDTLLQQQLREAPSEFVGAEQQVWYQQQYQQGNLRDPQEPARLIAAMILSTENGEVINIDGEQGRALMHLLETGQA